MKTIWQDIKYGFRMFRKNPGFTIVAICTLALSIGATTAIVSVVKVAVYDPLPRSHSEKLLQLGHVQKEQGWSQGIFCSAFREIQHQRNLFSRVTAYHWDALTLLSEDLPRQVPGMWVTMDFFPLWKVRPLMGRTFTADEGQPGKNNVLVISYRLWKREFGGDPSIVGRTVFFREQPMTVVGVMPSHFIFPSADYEYWRPVEYPDSSTGPYGPILQHGPNLRVIAETQSRVEVTEVQAFLDVLTQRQRQEQVHLSDAFVLRARDLRELFIAPELKRTFGLLLGASVFVLLIAASNVANLQFARMETRRRELATRAVLGAGRTRVFRQLLTESLLLAIFGGTAGLIVSFFAFELLQQLIPSNLPRLKPITLNVGVLGIASGVTLTTGLLFGLGPALRGRRSSLAEVIKQGETTGTYDRGRRRCSQALIAGQFALALVLLVGAGLIVRSVIGLLWVNPGLDPKHVVRVYPSISELRRRHYDPNPTLNRETEAAFAFFEDARRCVTEIPGVMDAGVGIEGGEEEASGIPGSPSTVLKKYWISVEESNLLRVLRVPLKQGRWLDRGDVGEGLRSVLINETAARRLWAEEPVVGKIFWAKELDVDVAYEVIGVVGDTLDYGKQAGPQPTFYRAIQKERGGVMTGGHFLVVRTAVDPVTLYGPIAQALKAAGADLKMPSFYNLHEQLWNAMSGHRALMLYLSLFAGVGLFLAAFGLYGVLAYGVARRTREIGIRMALGARVGDVTRLILRQGLMLVILGGVLGIAVALVTSRILHAYLFGVRSIDPLTILSVALLLGGVALFACWLPARRAARIDPMEALRYE
jgi:putative ABC transport system permease protein